MRREILPFVEVWKLIEGNSFTSRAVGALVQFLEKRVGGAMVYDVSNLPSGDPKLIPLHLLARKLQHAGVLKSYYQVERLPDEVQLIQWSAEFVVTDEHSTERPIASGSSMNDPCQALVAALAESVERHVWRERTDFFAASRLATTDQIAQQGDFLAPERFTSFSFAQRAGHTHLQLKSESVYQWIRGHSLITDRPIWVPGQLITGNSDFRKDRLVRHEPTISHATTNGLATRPTQIEARLYAALEVIERDAYMIMWLNQLSLPLFDLDNLARRSSSLRQLLNMCAQYRLIPKVIRLITDAPAYAVCAVVSDESGLEPKVTLGLKAHRDPASAAEGALLEALRMRQNVRQQKKFNTKWNPATPTKDIGHTDRLLYWSEPGRAERLAFLTAGAAQRFSEPWEEDSDVQHLERIILWCRDKGYGFAAVSMTHSAGNPTPWHIERALIPELQPIHLSERLPHIGGARLREIPKLFGYKPLPEPFISDPHPFA